MESEVRSPSLRFVFALLLGVLCAHAILVRIGGGDIPEIAAQIFDNSMYLETVDHLQRFEFQGVDVKHFWGFPLVTLIPTILFRMPPVYALIFISLIGAVLSVYLCDRLYGGFVAAGFAIGSHFWITYCIEG